MGHVARLADRLPQPRDIVATGFVVVPTLAVLAGKSTVPTLLVATALAVPAAWRQGWRPEPPSRWSGGLAAAAALWAAIAGLWSFDPAGSLSTAFRLSALVACAWALGDIAARVADPRDPQGRRLARCAVVGLASAATVLLVEMLFGMPVKTALTGLWEAGRPSGSETNRGGTFVLVALWLVLPLVRLTGARSRAAGLGLFALTVAAVAVAESGTNQVALLAGLVFAGLAWLGRAVRLTLWAAALGGLVAMPWLAHGLYGAGLHEAAALGQSAQHRVHIWHNVSDWALERAWLGWGYDSSADLPNRGVAPWDGYDSVIPLHPHNAALQIWLELGAVGVLLASAVVARAAQRAESAGAAWTPWLGAAAISALAAANLGYGIWQTQWVAALAWLTCYARAAVAIAPDGWPLARRSGATRPAGPPG